MHGSNVFAVRVTSGGLELVKWLALALMVVDHVNFVFFARELPLWATIAGRVSFPLFALVFAYNLARASGDRMRLLNRLVIAGAIAQPFHGLAFGTAYGLWPLNILFLFAGVVVAVTLVERRQDGLAVIAMAVTGLFAEYGCFGVLLCVAAWAYFRKPSLWSALGVVGGMLGLCLHNGNAHALWALPVFWLVANLDADVRRSRWAFYAFYPAHLAVLALI